VIHSFTHFLAGGATFTLFCPAKAFSQSGPQTPFFVGVRVVGGMLRKHFELTTFKQTKCEPANTVSNQWQRSVFRKHTTASQLTLRKLSSHELFTSSSIPLESNE
jgi:hypothetical protein